MAGHCGPHQVFAGIPFRVVAGVHGGDAAKILDLRLHPLRRLANPVAEHKRAALLREASRRRAADALACTGDDAYLAPKAPAPGRSRV